MIANPNNARWARYDLWDERQLGHDRFAVDDAENGFCATASPRDPRPSLVIENGRIVEMDGVPAAEFDMIDEFIARHYFDLTIAGEAMALDSREFARMLIDVAVPRERLVKLSAGMTPAKLAEVLGHLSTLELAFANSKLRCRRQPSNQAHVTNAKDDPVQMAADAATAALYGFDEIETTVRVARHGRTNAIACAVGAAVARDGVLIQCSLEEAEELRIALAGYTSYTETMSVYGTEAAFLDGDDTPWSKTFLTAAYASRGLKARCTSGSSAELLMGFHEGKSIFNAEELEDFLALQREFQVEGGLQHVPAGQLLAARARAIEAICAVLKTLNLGRLSEAQKRTVLYAHGSNDTDFGITVEGLRRQAEIAEQAGRTWPRTFGAARNSSRSPTRCCWSFTNCFGRGGPAAPPICGLRPITSAAPTGPKKQPGSSRRRQRFTSGAVFFNGVIEQRRCGWPNAWVTAARTQSALGHSASSPRPMNPVMAAGRRQTIKNNLFWAAHPAVEPWDKFHWHPSPTGEGCDTYKEHSSQALAIDVFGTIKVSPHRDAILDYLAADLGLPTGGPWQVDLEWANPENPLKERQRTWVDAVARNAHSLIFFECKFTEYDGGACSQTHPILKGANKGLVQCNRNYTWQINPANGRKARCALTGKDIRYWEVIHEVFDYEADRIYYPCPFAGSWFQWMRNLTNCWAAAQSLGLQPAFVVVYADGPGLPMAQRIKLPDWQHLLSRLRPEAVVFQARSFQSIVESSRAAVPGDPLWPELAGWVEQKVASVCGRAVR